uniref:GATA-type domain-containing protein n=1 Tax=Cannabis sativa TaxID=3483 RepID=A0A803Q9P5_CANSA
MAQAAICLGRLCMSQEMDPRRAQESLTLSGGSSGAGDSESALTSELAVPTMEFLRNLGEPPIKKPKKKPAAVQAGAGAVVGPQFQRRCSHCQVQKTPQWRTGPLGPKTLCNACGVRFKSGRLFPEYRPACSPTFSSEALVKVSGRQGLRKEDK